MKTLVLFILSLLGFVITILLNKLLTHYLSVSEYGNTSLAIKVFTVATFLLSLGTISTVQRFFSLYYQKKSKQLTVFIHWLTRFLFKGLLSFIILYSLFVITLLSLHLFDIKKLHTYHITVDFLWITPLSVIFSILCQFIISYKRILLSTFLCYIAPYLGLCITLFATKNVTNYTLTNTVLSTNLLTVYFILTLTTLLILRKKDLFEILHALTSKIKYNTEEISHIHIWRKTSLFLLLNSCIYKIVSCLDLIIISIILSSTEVGIYSVPLFIVEFFMLISRMIFQGIIPHVSKAHESGNTQELIKQTVQINRFNFVVTLAIAILFFIFARPILSYFGSHFKEGLKVFYILILSNITYNLARPAVVFLSLNGGEKLLVYTGCFEFLILIPCGILFTYYWGIEGTALATLLSMITKTLSANLFSNRRMKFNALKIF